MTEELRAEIVGTVLKVVASAGTDLSQGDTVLLLESMTVPFVTNPTTVTAIRLA